jgi:hypothetical protein
MPAYALADLLPDFGVPRGTPRRGPTPAATASSEPALVAVAEIAPRINAIEEAVKAAEAALEARLIEAHAKELAVLQESHAAEIQRLGAELGEGAGRTIAARFETMEGELLSLASAVVARVLGVALTEEVKRRAVEELGRSILEAVGDREAVRIRVRGPLLLYEALRPALGRFAERVEFSEDAGFDLTAAIDDSLFETRLADWSAALSEVLS